MSLCLDEFSEGDPLLRAGANAWCSGGAVERCAPPCLGMFLSVFMHMLGSDIEPLFDMCRS
jgi:hypothetical protein